MNGCILQFTTSLTCSVNIALPPWYYTRYEKLLHVIPQLTLLYQLIVLFPVGLCCYHPVDLCCYGDQLACVIFQIQVFQLITMFVFSTHMDIWFNSCPKSIIHTLRSLEKLGVHLPLTDNTSVDFS